MRYSGFKLRLQLALLSTTCLYQPACDYDDLSGPFEVSTQVIDPKEVIIHNAYEELARYVGAAGTSIRFKLDDFSTIERAEFGAVRMSEVVTMPGGHVVDVERRSRTFVRMDGDAVETASYQASWREMERRWDGTNAGKELEDMSLADLLERLPSENELKDATALTTFRVVVRLQGNERSYRAMAVWLGPVPGTSLVSTQVAFIDHITQRVSDAAGESLPTEQELGEAPLAVPEWLPYITGTCFAFLEPAYTVPSNKADKTGHVSGGHKSYAAWDFECGCSSNCAAICSGGVTGSCYDSGELTNPFDCHVPGSNVDATTVESAPGSPARCAAGYGCVFKSCFGCFCGVSVAVKAEGASVTFSDSGADHKSRSQNLSVTLVSTR